MQVTDRGNTVQGPFYSAWESIWKQHGSLFLSFTFPATMLVVSCAAAREPRPRDVWARGGPTSRGRASRAAAQETTWLGAGASTLTRLVPACFRRFDSHKWASVREPTQPWSAMTVDCPSWHIVDWTHVSGFAVINDVCFVLTRRRWDRGCLSELHPASAVVRSDQRGADY